MIASTMVRASAKGLPLRPVGRGSMSAIIDHWASESTWNLDIWPVSQDGRYIFVRHALGARHGAVLRLLGECPWSRRTAAHAPGSRREGRSPEHRPAPPDRAGALGARPEWPAQRPQGFG